MLAGAATDVLLDEALALTASRSVHTLTEELSVTAAVTKYLVPTGTENVIADLTKLLGARAFLKDVHARGMFQKVDRDHRIVGLFDGNTLVNLNSLVSQFRSLVRGYRRGTGGQDGARAAYDLSVALPALEPGRLSLVARRGSGVLASLPGSVDALRAEADANPTLKPALAHAERLLTVTDQLHTTMELYQNALTDVPPGAFEAAKQYALCLAAAASLGIWLHNHRAAEQGRTAALWRDGLWLRASLARLLTRLDPQAADDREAADALLDQVRALRTEGLLPSLLPLALPGASTVVPKKTEGTSC